MTSAAMIDVADASFDCALGTVYGLVALPLLIGAAAIFRLGVRK
jgi:hypothetical protein